MSEQELLLCPFCGGRAEIERRGTHGQSMIVACLHCGARVESGDVVGPTHPSAYRWNRRIANVPNVDWLANVIRSVDGRNSLGAGQLAEKIVEEMQARGGSA